MVLFIKQVFIVSIVTFTCQIHSVTGWSTGLRQPESVYDHYVYDEMVDPTDEQSFDDWEDFLLY